MRSLLIAAMFALSGCYPGAQTVRLKAPYDPASVRWAESKGDNSIQGTAMLRTRGGEVRTCAALDVHLIPVSVYAKERAIHLYGNVRGGFRPIYLPIAFEPESREYAESVRATKCDPTGQFEFEGLADGDWYVSSVVFWEVPGAGYQGGSLLQRVRVSGGQTAKIVLAQ